MKVQRAQAKPQQAAQGRNSIFKACKKKKKLLTICKNGFVNKMEATNQAR